jgi:hypothetical protein
MVFAINPKNESDFKSFQDKAKNFDENEARKKHHHHNWNGTHSAEWNRTHNGTDGMNRMNWTHSLEWNRTHNGTNGTNITAWTIRIAPPPTATPIKLPRYY